MNVCKWKSVFSIWKLIKGDLRGETKVEEVNELKLVNTDLETP